MRRRRFVGQISGALLAMIVPGAVLKLLRTGNLYVVRATVSSECLGQCLEKISAEPNSEYSQYTENLKQLAASRRLLRREIEQHSKSKVTIVTYWENESAFLEYKNNPATIGMLKSLRRQNVLIDEQVISLFS